MVREYLTEYPEEDTLSISPAEVREDFYDTEYSIPLTASEVEEYARKATQAYEGQISLRDRFRYGAGIADDLSTLFDEEVAVHLHEGNWNDELRAGYIEFSGGKIDDFKVSRFDRDEIADTRTRIIYDREGILTYRASIGNGLIPTTPEELVQTLYAPDRDMNGAEAFGLDHIGNSRYRHM